MEILTLPVGLVVGLFPVFVDLGPQPGAAAALLLDGQPACSLTAQAPGCIVDLGAEPRIHTLDLRRTDESGRVVEEIRRYLNRGFTGMVRALGSCDEPRGMCDFQVQWGHPARQTPTSISARVDGKPVRIINSRLTFASPRSAPAQILTLEATFPDRGRAEFTRLLHGSYPEEAEARLTAVPIETRDPVRAADLERSLRSAGWPLRAIEQGPTEILFAVEPGAFGSFAPGRGSTFRTGHEGPRRAARVALEGMDRVRFLSAGESLQPITFMREPGGPPDWMTAIESIGRMVSTVRVRVADAVAAGAFALNASAHRRIVVLVLGPEYVESKNPDASTFTQDGALAYLRDAGVPLAVWRTSAGRSSWPDETLIKTEDDLVRAAVRVHERLERQWTVWLEPGSSERALPSFPEGIARAGGERTSGSPTSTFVRSSDRRDDSLPVDVYSLSGDVARETVFAASREGLFETRDGGASWKRRSSPSQTPVFSVAAGIGPDRVVVAGTPGALWRVSDSSASSVPLPGVQYLAVRGAAESGRLFATARGQLCSADDGGQIWKCEGALSAAYASSISVDPADPRLAWAGTMGSGVFATGDGGRIWKPFGSALQNTAIRAVLGDPAARRLYAATDGGLFVSSEGGEWKTLPEFPRTITYAVAIDPHDAQRIFAGTEEGLFESADAGSSWTSRPLDGRKPVVTSLLAARDRLYVGTLGAGVVTVTIDPK